MNNSDFLYFIPNGKPGDVQTQFTANGLGYAIGPGSYVAQSVTFPKNNQAGCIYQHNGNAETCRFVDAEQTWSKIHGSECWVGVWNEYKPTPEILERKIRLNGYSLSLLDGNEWQIPIGRYASDNENIGMLAYMAMIDDNGNVVKGELLPDHKRLNVIAEELAEQFRSLADGTIDDFNYSNKYPYEILAYNYRVGIDEIILLHLWNFEDINALKVVQCFIDLPGYYEIKKKEGENF